MDKPGSSQLSDLPVWQAMESIRDYRHIYTSRMGVRVSAEPSNRPTRDAKSWGREQGLERRDDRLPRHLDLLVGGAGFVHGKPDDRPGATLAHLPGDVGLGVLGPRRQEIPSRFWYSAKSPSPRITGV